MTQEMTYSFGKLGFSGETYTKDLILLQGRVHSPWWRQAGGHVFAPEDLQQVIDAAPEIVVLGTGAYGFVKVRQQLLDALQEAGTKVIAERTGRAVEILNRLLDEGRDVAAALHLTC